jgi:hypothetical protein
MVNKAALPANGGQFLYTLSFFFITDSSFRKSGIMAITKVNSEIGGINPYQ